MHYIVDGYNLLFRILTSSVDLATRRQQIIENLNRKAKLLGIHVTIVFDSSYRLKESPKSHFDDLEIQFTSRGFTADEWIIEKVQHIPNPAAVTVVTSDKRLAWSVRHSSVKTESVEEFMTVLNKRIKNKLAEEKLSEEKLKQESLTPVRVVSKLKPKLIKPAEKKEKKKEVEKSKLKPEASFDYYLKQFEENYNKIKAPEKPAKKRVHEKKHEFPKKSKDSSKLKSESDVERWQRLFENDGA